MPTSYQGFATPDFERAASTTLADHIRELEDASTRNFPALAQLQSSGRITYNHVGRGFDWPVKYRIHQVEGNDFTTPRNWVQRNLFKIAALEYRGYQVVESMYENEFLANRGEAAIVKIYDDFITRLDDSIKQVLGKEVYRDGSAVGAEQFWHGFETLFKQTGTIDTTAAAPSIASRAANQADIVGAPSGSYATLNMALADAGGDWDSGIWPEGDGDPEVDYWAPMIVMTDSTNAIFTAGSKIQEAFRYAIIHCQKNATLDMQLTTGLLSRELYFKFENELDDKETINVEAEHNLRKLGFTNVINFEGIEFTFDSAIQANVGYGYSFRNCELRSQYGMLLASEGPMYDIDTQSYKGVVKTRSNKKYRSPRNFVKWMPFASFV
jgi:hypothetical protein